MKKSKKTSSRLSQADGEGCSSSSGGATSGGSANRLFPRLALQRFLYGTPLNPATNRRNPARNRKTHSKDIPRETATKSTSTAEVSNVEVEAPSPVVTPAPQVSPSPVSSSSPSSSSELHPPLPDTTPTPPLATDQGVKPRSSLVLECPLCLAELPRQCFPSLSTCEHRSCYDCLQTYLRVEISESRTSIACPECSERLHPNDVRMILNDKSVYAKYEDFMVRRVLAVDPDTRWCPQPDCGFAVIASGCASCPKLRCLRPSCPGVFCYHCKADWHPNQTCDAARDQRGRSATGDLGSAKSSNSSTLSRDNGIKPCPRCSVLIVKMDDGSCNHMTCAVCGAEFCWLCMKEISDLHYLSPSGCTFWGKKPWSRKKKILWQLGTLVGAPVGIALVAGIALPAMVIGIPVWVGRKLYGRYQYVNKHKRNLVIASGVTASILVSPLVAGIVVSIGVPILLFYIYGVVPVSLCRSGGCDVSTSGSGFHFDFDDDYSDEETDEDGGEGTAEGAEGRPRNKNGTELGQRLGYRGGNIADAMPLDSGSHKGINPSIGEASLSMDSGSHVERDDDDQEGDEEAARLHPRPSCEHRRGGQRGRMEVQAEVTSQNSHDHRLSLCSEGSANTADDGAASTRALAGSVLSYKVTGDSKAPDTAIEVHETPSGETARHSKHQEESGWDRVRFDDNVSVYKEELASPSGRRSPSVSSIGRAIRQLLLPSRGSTEKLPDCESPAAPSSKH